MAIEYTLHKLPEGFVITSNEDIEENDFYFWEVDKKIHQQNEFPKENFIYNDWKYSRHKVIVQQDHINFSALSEEEQKKIGWFDVKKLWEEDTKTISFGETNKFLHLQNYSRGFQKAQELISDSIDVEKILEEVDCLITALPVDWVGTGDLKSNKREEREWKDDYKKFIQYMSSLSKKSWKVELEMVVETLYTPDGLDYKGGLIPKRTNGKFKITKIYV